MNDVNLLDDSKFLIFKLCNNLYATPLIDVREVVEYQEPKPVPNTKLFCLGVVNIRGEIVGVYDLSEKFHKKRNINESNLPSMLIFDTENGAIAVLVDEVVSVNHFTENQVEKDINISFELGNEFLIGIAKQSKDLIMLVDLKKNLNKENYLVK